MRTPPFLLPDRRKNLMTELETFAPTRTTIASSDWAVAHDFAFTNGGAEAVTRWICHDTLPSAPLHYLAGHAPLVATLTPFTTARILPARFDESNFRRYAAAIPLLLERHRPLPMHLLASSYAFVSALPTEGRKVVYCHSPLRQAWSGAGAYSRGGPLLERIGTRTLGPYFRSYDRRAARGADAIIATSRAVRDRVHRYYRCEAEIIAPPIDDQTFAYDPLVDREDFFVWAGRITEPYKRLGIVLEAFRALPGARLVVVGDGRDRERLERIAPANVEFIGWRSRQALADLYRRARAVVFPSEDDFGLVAAEAAASGTPVLAYGRGGALDTVRDGQNGILFPHQTPDAVLGAVRRFEHETWSPAAIAEDARTRFGRAQFGRRLRTVLDEVVR